MSPGRVTPGDRLKELKNGGRFPSFLLTGCLMIPKCVPNSLLAQGLETKYMEILRFQASEEESWAAPPPVSQPPPCNR